MDRAHQEVSQLQFLAPWVLVTPLQNIIKDGDRDYRTVLDIFENKMI